MRAVAHSRTLRGRALAAIAFVVSCGIVIMSGPSRADGTPPAAPTAASDPCTTLSTTDVRGIGPQLPCILGRIKKSQPRALSSVTSSRAVVPGDAETTFIYEHRGSSPEPQGFLVFLSPVAADGTPDLANSIELPVTRADHPPRRDNTTDDMVAPDGLASWGLQAYVSAKAIEARSEPDRWKRWFGDVVNPRQPLLLTVVAYETSTTGPPTVSDFAQKQIALTHPLGALVVSLGLVVVVYLAVATLVWLGRRKAIREAARKISPPKRLALPKDLGWPRCLDPVIITSDTFDRASLSRFQILFFTLIVGFGSSYNLITTGSLSDFSTSIVFLLGIPAFGTLGSNAVGMTKDRLSLDNWSWLASKGILPTNDPGTAVPQWPELLMSDGEIDLYKVQAATFSIVVGGALISSGFVNMAGFTVPDTLLQILGLSQIVFVGGRFVKPSTLGDLDRLITELRVRTSALVTAVETGVDVGPDGCPLDPPPADIVAPNPPPTNLRDARKFVQKATDRYLDTASQVKLLLESLLYRDPHIGPLDNPLAGLASRPVGDPLPPDGQGAGGGVPPVKPAETPPPPEGDPTPAAGQPGP